MDEPQVYVMPSATPAHDDLVCAWSLLDEGEQAAASRFHFERDRHNYVLAHGLLRSALARHAGTTAAGLRFCVGQYGRPELVAEAGAGPRLRFNLSHTTGLVGCAIVPDADIGFDVEAIRRPAPLEIAEKHFTPEEAASVESLAPDRRDERFYTLWVLKEAYLKAQGVGLRVPLQSVHVDPTTWSLHWWAFSDHRAGLAVRRPALAGRAQLSLVKSLAGF